MVIRSLSNGGDGTGEIEAFQINSLRDDDSIRLDNHPVSCSIM
jgi:hypothetical protein